DGCVADAAQADNCNRKFGLRTMKSLRKTVWMAGALFLSAPFARLDAQTTGQGVPPATREQSSPAPAQQGGPTTIRIPVNQVIVPVTVKDGAGRLVPDLPRGLRPQPSPIALRLTDTLPPGMRRIWPALT